MSAALNKLLFVEPLAAEQVSIIFILRIIQLHVLTRANENITHFGMLFYLPLNHLISIDTVTVVKLKLSLVFFVEEPRLKS